MSDLAQLQRLVPDADEKLPVGLGMSWQKTNLDIDLSFPNEILPFAGRVYPFLNFVTGQ